MPSPTAESPEARTLLPQILFSYILLFQVALYFLMVYLHGDLNAPFASFSAPMLAPLGWEDPVTVGAYAVGLGAFVLAFLLPASLVRRAAAGRAPRVPGAGSSHPLSRVIGPYIIRLCLFEACALAGFVLAFLRGSPFPMLPLLALGVAGTLLSAPTAGFFARFRGFSG